MDNKQFEIDPRAFALELVEKGLVSADHLLMCALKYMSCDDVRDMLDCNELSLRFDEDESEVGDGDDGEDGELVLHDYRFVSDSATAEFRSWFVDVAACRFDQSCAGLDALVDKYAARKADGAKLTVYEDGIVIVDI